MENNFIRFFAEYGLPITFTFVEREKYIYEDILDYGEGIEPPILDRQFILDVVFKIDGKRYSYQDYKNYISVLSVNSLYEVEREINYVPDRTRFLKHISSRIEMNLKLFSYEDDVIIKEGAKFEFRDIPELDATPLTLSQVCQENHLKLFQPFLQLQHNSIYDFNRQFENLFGSNSESSKKSKGREIKFKYLELYRDPRYKQKIIKAFIELHNELLENRIIKNKTYRPLLSFFGLMPVKIKIDLGEYIGDWFTFKKELENRKILTGHTGPRLPLYINTSYSNWKSFHSVKDTLNQDKIEKIVERFDIRLIKIQEDYQNIQR